MTEKKVKKASAVNDDERFVRIEPAYGIIEVSMTWNVSCVVAWKSRVELMKSPSYDATSWSVTW